MDASFGYEGWEFDTQKITSYIKKICRSYKTPVDLNENKRSLVVFTTGDYLPFLKFITELDGRKYGTNSSILSGKIGQKLFSDNFSFYCSRNTDDVFSPFFDAEGVVNRDYRYPLIENGILKSPYTDKKISTQYNLPHTGSALSEHDSVPVPGFIASYVKESSKNIVDLLSGEKAIFVGISSGGDFTPGGDFGAPVQFALLFDGKNFIGRLPTLQISSNLYDMFGDSFRGVSKDRVFELSNDKYLVMEMNVSKM
jgi:PmbA protein